MGLFLFFSVRHMLMVVQANTLGRDGAGVRGWEDAPIQGGGRMQAEENKSCSPLLVFQTTESHFVLLTQHWPLPVSTGNISIPAQ